MHQRFLRLVAILSVAAFVLAACSSDDGGDTPPAASDGAAAEPADISGTTLTISNWDAYMPKSVIKDFEQETGVNVEYAIHTTNEDIMGKLTAANGSGFDLVFVSGPFVEPLTNLGYAAEIDQSQIPNIAQPRPGGDRAVLRPGQHAFRARTHGAPRASATGPTSWVRPRRAGRPSTRRRPTPTGR